MTPAESENSYLDSRKRIKIVFFFVVVRSHSETTFFVPTEGLEIRMKERKKYQTCMQVQEKQADNYKSFINTLSLGLLISLLIFVRLYNHFSFPSSFIFLSFFLRWSLCWNFFLLDSIPGFLSHVTVTMTCTPRIIAKLNFLTEERIHFICLGNVTPLYAVFDFVNDQLIS